MTRTDRLTRSRSKRGLVGAAVVLTAGLLTATDGADASVRTKSATIAEEADRALAALDRWEADHNPADYVSFIRSRDEAADMTASDLDVDPDALSSEWATAPIDKQQAVLAAMSQLGVPYKSIASEPGVGFDCSGLLIWAFAQAGLEIPRTSGDQFRAAEEIGQADAEPGDFVYYPGHISMYLGAGTMVHSPNSGSHVEAVLVPSKRSVDFADPLG